MSELSERHPRGRELSSCLDGGLSRRRAEAVARHVETCPACARELAALRDVKSALASQREVEARPGWLRQVQEEVAAGTRPSS
ncbi:MAG TPA: zf-HC2 domain-containing protein, partial [Actinomycetota bacterium]